MSFLHQGVHSLHQAVEQGLRQWPKPDNHAVTLNAGLDLTRCKTELVLENALLGQQLIVLERQIKRPKRAKLSRGPGVIGRLSCSWQAGSAGGKTH